MNIDNFNGMDSFIRLKKFPSEKGGGLYKFKRTLTKEECLCSSCSQRTNKGKCEMELCPIIEQRLKYGLVPFEEILKSIYSSLNDEEINKRVETYLEELQMKNTMFNTIGHQHRFERNLKCINKSYKSLVAAIYLLTAEKKVWDQCWSKLQYSNIPLENITLKDSGENGYLFFCAARDIFLGTKYLSIGEIADKNIVSQKAFNIITNALAIKRYGVKAIYTTENKKE